MDIRIYYKYGAVKDIDNVNTIESLRAGKELLILYKSDDGEADIVTVQCADLARVTIFGERRL